MWTQNEISEISKTLNETTIDEILSEEEISAIPTTALVNIQNRILVPKHDRKVSLSIINYKAYVLVQYMCTAYVLVFYLVQ